MGVSAVPNPLRRLRVVVLIGTFGLVAGALALGFSGQFATVVTHGVSMNPLYYEGDLVVVAERPSYHIGQPVAYHRPGHSDVVLHRIVGGDASGYIFQGDNNPAPDPTNPPHEQLAGAAVLHVPQGGVWLDRLTSPTTLAFLAFGLLATGGTAVSRRRRQRRRTVSQHAARTSQRNGRSLSGLPHWATTIAAAAGVVGVLGLALGVPAWTASTAPTTPGAGTTTNDAGQSMTFSYTASVPESPAYDDTTVTAPQPIFRKLTDTVDVEYSYEGDPGTVAVAAELSTASGWHSTVPLGTPKTFTEDSYTGTVSLDLKALEKRAFAAAEATGIPASQLDIAVVPTVTAPGSKAFAPELALALTPLQLTLVGDKSALSVGDTTPAATAEASATAPTLSFAGREIPVSTARTLSVVMAIAALLAALVVGVFARMSAPATESAAIHRRYAQMLVQVQPMPTPPGRPVIDVVDFATLAKLAERYELLILTWSRSDVETFVVQDQGTTYRYRAGTGVPHSSAEVVAQTV
jgi:signal peptidase I